MKRTTNKPIAFTKQDLMLYVMLGADGFKALITAVAVGQRGAQLAPVMQPFLQRYVNNSPARDYASLWSGIVAEAAKLGVGE